MLCFQLVVLVSAAEALHVRGFVLQCTWRAIECCDVLLAEQLHFVQVVAVCSACQWANSLKCDANCL